jgi:hypothetical protein
VKGWGALLALAVISVAEPTLGLLAIAFSIVAMVCATKGNAPRLKRGVWFVLVANTLLFLGAVLWLFT